MALIITSRARCYLICLFIRRSPRHLTRPVSRFDVSRSRRDHKPFGATSAFHFLRQHICCSAHSSSHLVFLFRIFSRAPRRPIFMATARLFAPRLFFSPIYFYFLPVSHFSVPLRLEAERSVIAFLLARRSPFAVRTAIALRFSGPKRYGKANSECRLCISSIKRLKREETRLFFASFCSAALKT